MGSDLKWCGKGHIPQISKQKKKLKLKENLNEKKLEINIDLIDSWLWRNQKSE